MPNDLYLLVRPVGPVISTLRLQRRLESFNACKVDGLLKIVDLSRGRRREEKRKGRENFTTKVTFNNTSL